MPARQTLSLAAFGFAVAAILSVSAMAETDLSAPADSLLFGDPAPVVSSAASPAASSAAPSQGDAATLGAWPCVEAPGCDRPAPTGYAISALQLETPPAAMAEAAAVPLPAALTLLGFALSGTALGLRARRRKG
ncbi:hypothetical protein SAMN05444336_102484 [Albimonas donghaensis]|uniref:VPLPA-CTERM protein sorting domain-containing protein n=1 Tax=Albimonas donghaensis TaxID=356660 RepID=A0A1H2WSW6_9RHOB|nr:hypothetical protein [Albimonas donghaensis]SDW83647.1 hypothetical protein SAMN05444336_102484 [Albimonas donghaensis]